MVKERAYKKKLKEQEEAEEAAEREAEEAAAAAGDDEWFCSIYTIQAWIGHNKLMSKEKEKGDKDKKVREFEWFEVETKVR